MNKNELRVGNTVRVKGVDLPAKVGEIKETYCRLHTTTSTESSTMTVDFYAPYSGLVPIPLTEEDLVGFQKETREDWGFKKFTVHHRDGVDIHEGNHPTEFLYATYMKGTQRSFKAGRRIEHLHELQNLMFALTGREL